MNQRSPAPRLALAATCGAAALLLPPEVVAFSTTGSTLAFDQRDVRVFNNFADPEANDNVTPHPSWRSTNWLKKNPFFAKDVLPELRKRVKELL